MHCGIYHIQSYGYSVHKKKKNKKNSHAKVYVHTTYCRNSSVLVCYYVCDCSISEFDVCESHSSVKVNSYDFALHVTLNLAHLRFFTVARHPQLALRC